MQSMMPVSNHQPSNNHRKVCLYCGLSFIGLVNVCPTDGTRLVLAEVPAQEATVIEGYYLERELGRGGSSVVYKATQLMDGTSVAVKLLHSWLVTDVGAVHRFCQEAELASALDSQYVVGVRKFGITPGGRPYMVLEYVEGHCLDSFLDAELPLSAAWALPIFIQLAWGLAHCHNVGVVHGDIKPGNVMLMEDGEGANIVKITDFGIAKKLGAPNLVSDGETFGSPAYMSPEQCLGRNFDQRADVYSMGCLMYEVLTGKTPFIAKDPVAVMHMHLGKAPQPLQLSKDDSGCGLEKVVLKAMSKNAGDRYSDMSRLQIDLQKCLNNVRAAHIAAVQGVSRVA